MKKVIICIGFTLLLVVTDFFPVRNCAKAYFLSEVPELNEPENMLSDEEFIKQTEEILIYSKNGEKVNFSIRVPKGWEREEIIESSSFGLSNKIVTDIAIFKSPPAYGFRSKITISAMLMDYEISAKSWVVNYLTSQGFAIEGIKEYGKNQAEVEYVKIGSDSPYRSRIMVMTEGLKVTIAEFMSPLQPYLDERAIQTKTVRSFRIYETGEKVKTSMKQYSFLDISQVSYPSSWEIRATPIQEIDTMSVSFFNLEKSDDPDKSDKMIGKISVEMFSSFVPGLKIQKKVEEIRDNEIESINMSIYNKLEEITSFNPDPYISSYKSEIFGIEAESKYVLRHEYWITLLEAQDYYYIVSMITPERQKRFDTWSENAEMYKLIIESIQPYK